jgi:regulator of protease activity HflC (stomatin/prohibitin superfamily)
MFLVNITEVTVNAEPQEIITSDKLNARVDAPVYLKLKSDELDRTRLLWNDC